MWGGGKTAIVGLSPHTAEMRLLYEQATTTMSFSSLNEGLEQKQNRQ